MVRVRRRIQGDDRAQRIRWWRIQGGGFSRDTGTGERRQEEERKERLESCRVCAVGCFSVLPCPALLVVVCANLSTCRLVGKLASGARSG